jgi:hypothetical protein
VEANAFIAVIREGRNKNKNKHHLFLSYFFALSQKVSGVLVALVRADDQSK